MATKRSASSDDINVPPVSRSKCQMQQRILLKREFLQQSNKQNDNVVLYKVDCENTANKQRSMVYVETKELYDSLVKENTYDMELERRQNNRWWLVSAQECEGIIVEPPQKITSLLENHFKDPTITYIVDIYVQNAYPSNNYVKIIGLTEYNYQMYQIDLICYINKIQAFEISPELPIEIRMGQLINDVQTRLQNQWWSFNVVCKMFNGRKTLELKEYSKLESTEKPEVCIPKEFTNLLYIDKYCVCEPIVGVSNAEALDKHNSLAPRISMTVETQDGTKLQGLKFLTNTDTLVTAEDNVEALYNSNTDFSTGKYKVYAVYTRKPSMNYINFITVFSLDDNNKCVNYVDV
ncbi:late expression factor 3 [Phthorimaea operculella granulovirus]|uniref:Late expression factor 3 n=1 Tax=Phthorimaea operculella granulovirus TaxID=192584 RepID=Q8JRV4_9BBAC|nr:late expression factor 3 [Phthorimaea operculella granulovirus]AAM70303.1 late expression factor 3 [Phthorimaea operculella granulovirus]